MYNYKVKGAQHTHEVVGQGGQPSRLHVLTTGGPRHSKCLFVRVQRDCAKSHTLVGTAHWWGFWGAAHPLAREVQWVAEGRLSLYRMDPPRLSSCTQAHMAHATKLPRQQKRTNAQFGDDANAECRRVCTAVQRVGRDESRGVGTALWRVVALLVFPTRSRRRVPRGPRRRVSDSGAGWAPAVQPDPGVRNVAGVERVERLPGCGMTAA